MWFFRVECTLRFLHKMVGTSEWEYEGREYIRGLSEQGGTTEKDVSKFRGVQTIYEARHEVDPLNGTRSRSKFKVLLPPGLTQQSKGLSLLTNTCLPIRP